MNHPYLIASYIIPMLVNLISSFNVTLKELKSDYHRRKAYLELRRAHEENWIKWAGIYEPAVRVKHILLRTLYTFLPILNIVVFVYNFLWLILDIFENVLNKPLLSDPYEH